MNAALIFDMDGVLADTVGPHCRSWQRLARECGLPPFSAQDNAALLGRSREHALALLLRGRPVGEPERERLLLRKQSLFLAEIHDLGPAALLPGAAELLHAARARGLPLGLASASRNAHEVCSRLGILALFDALADATTVIRHKPAPDVFVWVAGRLGLPPTRCVVLEDAAAGVVAAQLAGCRVVGVGDPAQVGAAHLLRATLAGLTVDDLLALLP